MLENLGSPSQCWVRSESLISATMDGETLMLDSHSGMYYGLDPVGTQIWEYLASPITVPDLVERLREQYDVETQCCARDVANLIDQLAARKMVKTADA